METELIKESEDSDSLSFDLDGDGVNDVIVRDTNGHTIYVNLKWLIGTAIGLGSAIVGIVML